MSNRDTVLSQIMERRENIPLGNMGLWYLGVLENTILCVCGFVELFSIPSIIWYTMVCESLVLTGLFYFPWITVFTSVVSKELFFHPSIISFPSIFGVSLCVQLFQILHCICLELKRLFSLPSIISNATFCVWGTQKVISHPFDF